MQLRPFLLAAAMLPPLAARAQTAASQPLSGPYVSLGAGANFLQDEILDPSARLRLPQQTAVFDPGFAGEVSLGWGFGNGLRAEIEGDFLDNHVRKVDSPAPRRAGGTEEQYGGMVNVLYDFDVPFPIHPYAGVGIGGQVFQVNGYNSSVADAVFPHAGGSQFADSFAYQAIVGVSYPVPYVPGLALTAEYRFLGMANPLGIEESTYAATGRYIATGPRNFTNDFNHSVMLGLRYAFTRPSPPAPPAPVAPPPVIPAHTYLVFFDWDRADLTDRAKQIVDEAADASTHAQTTRIEVAGYTDTSGSPAYNQQLSWRRAQNVAAELVRDGVPQAEIAMHGFGDTHLLVRTAPGIREPQNRRVEIIVH